MKDSIRNEIRQKVASGETDGRLMLLVEDSERYESLMSETDDSEVKPGEMPSTPQMLHKLLTCDTEYRTMMVDNFINSSARALHCEATHDGMENTLATISQLLEGVMGGQGSPETKSLAAQIDTLIRSGNTEMTTEI